MDSKNATNCANVSKGDLNNEFLFNNPFLVFFLESWKDQSTKIFREPLLISKNDTRSCKRLKRRLSISNCALSLKLGLTTYVNVWRHSPSWYSMCHTLLWPNWYVAIFQSLFFQQKKEHNDLQFKMLSIILRSVHHVFGDIVGSFRTHDGTIGTMHIKHITHMEVHNCISEGHIEKTVVNL